MAKLDAQFVFKRILINDALRCLGKVLREFHDSDYKTVELIPKLRVKHTAFIFSGFI